MATVLVMMAMALAAPPWLIRAERTDFLETSRYEETLQDCRRLERDSPWIKVTSFGKSPEGRDLILVIASKDRAFDPAAAERTGKPIVLIQAGIHAGEIDGKDAGLMLLRDIAVTKRHAALLERAIILFMPIYNVDGHERFGAFNRINQDGPKEQGWRVTSRNLNLNRDYMKADAVETRAWLRLFTTWWPHLVIDCHVTDGADYRYDVTYYIETGPNAPPSVAAWIRSAVEDHAVPALEASGHLSSPFIFLKDDADPAAGLVSFPPTPRFSTSYAALQNRPSFLIETHMLKDYRTRVIATYDTLRVLLEEVNRDADALKEAVKLADTRAARPGTVPLVFRTADRARKVTFHGVGYRRELSEVSGTVRIVYGKEPLDLELDRADEIEPVVSVEKPAAYIVPPQWTDVIDVLKAHGLRLLRLKESVTGAFDGYRLTEPSWQAAPFEGRHAVTFKTERIKSEQRTYPAGSVVVPTDQRSSAVAVHLLEPQGPDSFVAWGFFDAIFEQKEYAEAYVMESLSREMLAKDPALRAEFEKALADSAFAASPARRLDFFYRRSPWWDDRIGLYPVGLVTAQRELPAEPLP
jgi:murein tripeptide amidase MpaA